MEANARKSKQETKSKENYKNSINQIDTIQHEKQKYTGCYF